MKKQGFTLAEVLITLGIIGVVAAMTIPNLIANTNSARFSSGFKKALASVAQVGEMGQAHYDFDFSGVTASSACETDNPEKDITLCALLNGSLSGKTYIGTSPKLKDGTTGYDVKPGTGASTITSGVITSGLSWYRLADGSMLGVQAGAKNCTIPVGQSLASYSTDENLKTCYALIDVNGVTLPNKEVTCTSGTNSIINSSNTTGCEVKRDNHLTDVFPIVFHDGTAEPLTTAAVGVFTGK